MLQRIRTVMTEQHIGAILIALLALDAFAYLLQIVATPLLLVLAPAPDPANLLEQRRAAYGWSEFVNHAVYFLLHALFIALLWHWLYRPKTNHQAAAEAEEV